MRTLQLYLTRQIVASLLLTVAVFTFVLLLGNVLREVLTLLVNRQVSLGLVLQAIALLVPFVLAFALPMGMLTATLLVFGRFSADQELTAVRASGIGLLSLATPILLLSLLLCGVCAFINMELAPHCRVAYKDLLLRFGIESSTALLAERRFNTDIPGYVIYVDKVRGSQLKDVLLIQQTNNLQMLIVRAEGGTLTVNEQRAELVLTNAEVHQRLADRWQPGSAGVVPISIEFPPQTEREASLKISDMTFWQLRDKLEQLEQLAFQRQPVRRLASDQLREELRRLNRFKSDLTMPVRLHLHREVAFSFACFGFALVGIPLGIRAHRRETSVGVALALVLVILYYSFIILAQALQTRAEFAPHLILWLPNLVFQAVGAVLLWRVNRG